MINITDDIYYVGVNDRSKSLFEGLWPLPNGVSCFYLFQNLEKHIFFQTLLQR